MNNMSKLLEGTHSVTVSPSGNHSNNAGTSLTANRATYMGDRDINELESLHPAGEINSSEKMNNSVV